MLRRVRMARAFNETANSVSLSTFGAQEGIRTLKNLRSERSNCTNLYMSLARAQTHGGSEGSCLST
jgi:hypothetical protein